MIALLIIAIAVAASLGIALGDAKQQLDRLRIAVNEKEALLHKSSDECVLSADNVRSKNVALNWTYRKSEDHETVICVERDPTGKKPDTITHRYERTLDAQGRCLTEMHFAESGLIQKSIFEYGAGTSKDPIRIVHFDPDGTQEEWADVLQDKQGRPLAYLRCRKYNNLRDIGLYEYDSHGELIKAYEVGYVEWPFSLHDIPDYFHKQFSEDKYTVIEYEYGSSATQGTPPRCLLHVKQGSIVQDCISHKGSVKQIIQSNAGCMEKAIHYFPSETHPALTVVIGHGINPLAFHLNLAEIQYIAPSEFYDATRETS